MQSENPSGGAQGPTGPAPQLPDAAPKAVQDLLNGIFGGVDAVGRAFGDAISGLAGAIGDAVGGGGSAAAGLLAPKLPAALAIVPEVAAYA